MTRSGHMLGLNTQKRHAQAFLEHDIFSESNFVPLKRLRLDEEAPGTPSLPFIVTSSLPLETNAEGDPAVKISYPDVIELPDASEHLDGDNEDGATASTLGGRRRGRTSFDGGDESGSDGRMSNQSIRAHILRRRVGGSNLRLVLPENVTIPGIPSVVLGAGPDRRTPFGPAMPEVDDSLALVPYVPRQRILFPSWNGAQSATLQLPSENDESTGELNAMEEVEEPSLPLPTPPVDTQGAQSQTLDEMSDGFETTDAPMEMDVEMQ